MESAFQTKCIQESFPKGTAVATKQKALQEEREQNKVDALERMQSHLGDQIFTQNELEIMS